MAGSEGCDCVQNNKTLGTAPGLGDYDEMRFVSRIWTRCSMAWLVETTVELAKDGEWRTRKQRSFELNGGLKKEYHFVPF